MEAINVPMGIPSIFAALKPTYMLAITDALYSTGTIFAPVDINFTVINEAMPP